MTGPTPAAAPAAPAAPAGPARGRDVGGVPGVRHLLADDDLDAGEVARLLEAAQARADGEDVSRPLAGRVVALVFDLPSTRTRVTFEVAAHALGAHPMVLDSRSTQVSRGEPVEDFTRVVDRHVAALVWRTGAHDRLVAAAGVSAVPVVNALTDALHPCQALADLLTLRQLRGDPAGAVLAYVGDGNNVAASLMLAGAAAGLHVRVATPVGFGPDPAVVARAAALAAGAGGDRPGSGGTVEVTTDLDAAVRGADVLYTDVWASMGQEDGDARRAAFARWTLDLPHLAAAADGAVVLHCLPAHRGEEISAALLASPACHVWRQAENRRWVSEALLASLVAPGPAAAVPGT